MNYLNFKNLVTDLQTLSDNHKQLKSFGIGSIEQLIYLTQRKDDQPNPDNEAPIYPLMYVIPQPSEVQENFLTYSVSVIIADIMNTKNYDPQVDLWSDTFQIAQDVIAQFKYSVDASQGNYESKYDIELPVTCNPFSESYDDLLVGWSFNLSVIVDQPLNRCIAPFNSF